MHDYLSVAAHMARVTSPASVYSFDNCVCVCLWNTAGVTVILFVFRLLKAFDFQPIMGIVTRTLWQSSADMANFFVLCFLSMNLQTVCTCHQICLRSLCACGQDFLLRLLTCECFCVLF